MSRVRIPPAVGTKARFRKETEYPSIDEAKIHAAAQALSDRLKPAAPSFFGRSPKPNIRLMKLLTASGDSELYSGEYQNQLVTIKKMSMGAPNVRIGFTRLQRLDSPYITRVITEKLERPHVYFILEPFVGTLNTTLHDRSFDLTPAKCLQIGRDIARALAYLHGKDGVLCNLNPDNILLDKESRAKLVDMRCLKLTEAKSELHGTLSYLPAEAFRDQKNSQASDIYSFGVILLEIFYRSYDPSNYFADFIIRAVEEFLASSVEDRIRSGVMQSELLNAINRLEYGKVCSKPLADLIRQCIDEDPKKRPAAIDIVKELTAMLQFVPQRKEEKSLAASDVAPSRKDAVSDKEQLLTSPVHAQPSTSIATIEESITTGNDELRAPLLPVPLSSSATLFQTASDHQKKKVAASRNQPETPSRACCGFW